ncbi:MAG: urease accessory protein UreE [Candidatus Brocadia sp.]|nr:urease accessory protein UreE [Candidatus Brocadia sp.]
MILKNVLGKLRDFDIASKKIEWVCITWDETDKGILRKTTSEGREVGVSLDEPRRLRHEDVLYVGEKEVVAVELLPSKALVIRPLDVYETALLCYQLGNRHARVYYEDGQIMVPYDYTLEGLLVKLGFVLKVEEKRLDNALHSGSGNHRH